MKASDKKFLEKVMLNALLNGECFIKMSVDKKGRIRRRIVNQFKGCDCGTR